jgi:hypothetical protein
MVMIRSGDRRVPAAWKPTDLIKTQSMIWLPWILAERRRRTRHWITVASLNHE